MRELRNVARSSSGSDEHGKLHARESSSMRFGHDNKENDEYLVALWSGAITQARSTTLREGHLSETLKDSRNRHWTLMERAMSNDSLPGSSPYLQSPCASVSRRPCDEILPNSDDEIAELRAKNQKYAQELNKMRTTNDELRQQLYDATRERSRLKIELKSTADDLEDVQEELSEVETARDLIKTEGHNEQIRLLAQIDELTNENETLRMTVTKNKKSHQDEVDEYSEKVAALSKALEAQRTIGDECTRMSTEIERYVCSNRQLERDNAALKERLKEPMMEENEVERPLMDEIEKLTQKLQCVSESKERLEDELERAESGNSRKVKELDSTIEDLLSRQAGSTEERNYLMNRLKSNSDELSETSKLNEEYLVLLEDNSAKLCLLERELTSHKATINILSDDNSNLRMSVTFAQSLAEATQNLLKKSTEKSAVDSKESANMISVLENRIRSLERDASQLGMTKRKFESVRKELAHQLEMAKIGESCAREVRERDSDAIRRLKRQILELEDAQVQLESQIRRMNKL